VALGFGIDHLNDLNTKLEVQLKLISGMFRAVRHFEMKLKLFRKQVVSVKLCFLLALVS
jgi:hypothetical protein